MSENNSNNETKLVPAVCTQCGGQLTVDPGQEAAVCPYCNTPFIVSKAINNYNTIHIHQNVQNNIRIQHGKRGIFESAAELIDHQLEREQNALIRQKELEIEKEKLNLIKQERKKEQTAKIWKYVGYFFGWIYCFPIPLMLVLKKKDDIDPRRKKQYIIAAWAVYLLFIVFAMTTSKSGTTNSASSEESVVQETLSAGKYTITLPSGYKIDTTEEPLEAVSEDLAAVVSFTESDMTISNLQTLLTDPSSAYSYIESNFDNIISLNSDTEEQHGLSIVKYYIKGLAKGADEEKQEYLAFITDGENIVSVDLYGFLKDRDKEKDFEAIIDSIH